MYERYNVAFSDLQGGGSGVMSADSFSFDKLKDAVVGPDGAVEKLKRATGLGGSADGGGGDRA